MTELVANPDCCQEASSLSGSFYIPCNRPAMAVIGWPKQEGSPSIRVCPMCEYHNLRNHGATRCGDYTPAVSDPARTEAAAQAADLSAYEADATDAVTDGNILSRITNVARELRTAQAEQEHAEELLKLAKERVRVLEQLTLPQLMDEAAQKKLTTADGYDLERGETLRAAIPPLNLPAAIAWLRSNHQEAIIKRSLSLEFGKGEDQKAAEVRDAILEAGGRPTDKQGVHPMTLAATIREMLAEGVEVPMELLGAYAQPWVKMKKAK